MYSSATPSRSGRPASAVTSSQLSSTRPLTRPLMPTSSSRPVATPSQTGQEDSFVVAVIDTSEKHVGFCAYDHHGFDVQMRQFQDSNAYKQVIAALCLFSPVEILLPASSVHGLLNLAIRSCSHLAGIKCTLIDRSNFDQDIGAFFARELSDDPCPTLARLGEPSCYLALASCGALIRYIEDVRNTNFAPSSLRIRFQSNDQTVFLDMPTLEFLEVVSNARALKGLQELSPPSCLLSVMDLTMTRGGKRSLRHWLLEPSSDIATISMRQEAVEELLLSGNMYFDVSKSLRGFPDLERAMAALMSRESAQLRAVDTARNPDRPTDNRKLSDDEDFEPAPIRRVRPRLDRRPSKARRPFFNLIRTILTIKRALLAVGPMSQAIQNSKSPLLRRIAEDMTDLRLCLLKREIDTVIEADAIPANDAERMRMIGAFAVKAGRNGAYSYFLTCPSAHQEACLLLANVLFLIFRVRSGELVLDRLDIARKILAEKLEDMEVLREKLSEKYHWKKLTLCFLVSRGYHFSVPVNLSDGQDFQEEFIEIERLKHVCRFSSEELVALNLRFQDALQDIWQFTEIELGALLNEICKPTSLSAIHRLCDSTAQLDCITAFAAYEYSNILVSQVPMVRPQVTEHGPIKLQQAYHPVLYDISPETTVPNDVYLDETSALLIISGKNQAGKSTYIRKVGILCIMAQTGCKVPAVFASLRVLQRIVTASGSGDGVAQSQSQFSKEMRELKTILDSISENNTRTRGRQRSRDAEPSRAGETEPPNVLVLIDELGHSTSALDGFAIAYAVVERLAASRNVLTLFATHVLGLDVISTVNPVVKNFHMGSENSDAARDMASRNQHQQHVARSDYKLTEGTLTSSSYGIETAKLAGFPKVVIDVALRVRNWLPVSHTTVSI